MPLCAFLSAFHASFRACGFARILRSASSKCPSAASHSPSLSSLLAPLSATITSPAVSSSSSVLIPGGFSMNRFAGMGW